MKIIIKCLAVIFTLMIYGCKTNGDEIKKYFFEDQMTAPAEMRFLKKDSIEVYQSENFIKKYGDQSSNIFENIEILKKEFKASSPKMTTVLYLNDTMFKYKYDGRFFNENSTFLLSNSETLPNYNIDNILFHELIHIFQYQAWNLNTIAEKNKGAFQWIIEGHALFLSYNLKHAGENIKTDRAYILDYTKKLNTAYANGESYSLKGIEHIYQLTELGKYNYGVFWGFAEFIDEEYGIEKITHYNNELINSSHENAIKKVFGDSEKELLKKFKNKWPEFFY